MTHWLCACQRAHRHLHRQSSALTLTGSRPQQVRLHQLQPLLLRLLEQGRAACVIAALRHAEGDTVALLGVDVDLLLRACFDESVVYGCSLTLS